MGRRNLGLDGAGGQGAPATAGDATWIHAIYPGTPWSTPGGDFVASPSGSLIMAGLGTAEWSGPGLVADVQAWVDGTALAQGWIIATPAGTPEGTARRFTTRENALGGGQLLVEFTPPTPCPCVADFDASGGTPDAGDIDAFFASWLAGDTLADADCSGGTPDASDIDTFFAQWLAGGC